MPLLLNRALMEREGLRFVPAMAAYLREERMEEAEELMDNVR